MLCGNRWSRRSYKVTIQPQIDTDQSCLLCHDLIVIGKHGEAEKDVALLGSVTKHVIYEAGCDVLLVTDDTPANLALNADL